uniref:Integrator complex subunit 2-like n=1 Tax=Sinocyclocheilus grahami TaxID=75366 RepID=A0A672T6B2_SINGR
CTPRAYLQFVSPYAFEAMQKVDVARLAALSDPELRLLLPCLVRMALCAPADQSNAWAQDKKLILRLLSGVEAVNSIVALLSVDFHALEQDARKEQQLRHKAGGSNSESILVSQLQHGLTLEFEHSDPLRRLRLALSELLAIMNKVADSNGEFFLKSSELFESPVYLEEVADVLCILQAELPSLLPIIEMAEALLHVRNGEWFLCLLVANSLLSFHRSQVLVESIAYLCEAPFRASLKCFVLLNDQFSRRIFHSRLNHFRERAFINVFFLHRPTDEEAEQLLQLMTSRPPATPAGVRFVSLSFCKLLAFPTLVSTPEQEQLMVMWLSWMIKEEEYFESAAGVSASFGEMLLLVAMYFHSNQLSAIIELVCSTLGMKIAIKPSSLSKMKTIFTQEIFTEQVVTAHAVRVAVTNNLSANITGFLPIHCIYQLLRSRAFTKHKVSIKVILMPEATNQPITEQEILNVFQDGGKVRSQHTITTQLLILYYILSYEEALLANTKTLALMQKKPKSYSPALMDQIPIKHLIRQAQGLQQELGGLHSALLRLLATNYPHLCMVEDWISEEEVTGTLPLLRKMLLTSSSCKYSQTQLREAFQNVLSGGPRLLRILEHLTLLSAGDLIPYAEALTASMGLLLEDGVSRRILQTVNKLWMVLNTVMPRKLWVMTVNAQQPLVKLLRQQRYTQNDLMVDPLIVLRCDSRVFRNPIIHANCYADNILKKKSNYKIDEIFLILHYRSKVWGWQDFLVTLLFRDQFTLLTSCLLTCIVLSYWLFISGYPQALLPLTVAGIPSMHICLDFIPELLAQPQLEKQIFAIQLLSHLCTQYALPKSLSVARLAISVMGTILTVLTRAKRFAFFMPTLPCLVSFCKAFPPLFDDVMSLLVQVGQVSAADITTKARDIDPLIARLQYMRQKPQEIPLSESKYSLRKRSAEELGRADPDVQLCYQIEATFMDIISSSTQAL